MKTYEPQTGDIILEDSNRFGARMVKYFMRSPTLWQDLYRMFKKTLENVEYYHVAMIHQVKDGKITEIEQQNKVQIGDWNKDHPQIIFRKKNLPMSKQRMLRWFSECYLGGGYDIVNIFGKLLTWLTGFKFFARYVEWPIDEICVNRVAHWYNMIVREDFGVQEHSELTTHQLYKYLLNNSEYEVVYKNKNI